MLEAQAGSFLSGEGMLREGLLQMAEEIAPLPGMELLSSENKLQFEHRHVLFHDFKVISENSDIRVRHDRRLFMLAL